MINIFWISKEEGFKRKQKKKKKINKLKINR